MNLITISFGAGSAPSSLWTTIFTGLAVALGGGLVLFGLNWLREYLMAKWNRHTEAEVLAFSLASELDRLISACYGVANDPQEEDRETGEWEPTAKSPSLTWGENLKWSSFPRSLHYRIRALPNKIDAAKKSCQNAAEYGDGPPHYNDYFREREERFSWIGLEACALRQELSDHYGVEMIQRGEWDPEESFKGKIAEAEKMKAILANLPEPGFLRKKIPIEELEKRRAALGTALEAARGKMVARHSQWT
ncbi:hypothetical protein [Rhizobium leguminosarum]|uniref:hypothetical protein n=1 Tax=Rhizobium leguminosarum TaxID=384 RepID=UPI0013BC7030|nr:hypothetical protein [Rhizobium leguminosarum]NEI64972.1 hypothetical protein [Rhizobium leguminosarum]NZD54166.1 hypothetical protein [Rhizobium leguminosarum]